MSISWRYGIFMALIHLVIGFMAFRSLQNQKLLFIGAELLLLVSLAMAYQIYKALIRPFRFLESGIHAINDQDFSIRFRKTRSRPMNQLITVYNTMLDNIQRERIQVKEQHFFLEKLIQASPAGMVLLDYDDKIASINPQAQLMLGLVEDPSNQPLKCISHPVLSAIADWPTGKSGIVRGNGQEQFRCEVAQFIHRGFPRKFITLQELSREILAAEKRAYGKVIRMMAHEVNNSIGAINSILQTTLESYPDVAEDDFAEDIRQSLQIAIDRNQKLNAFMRNFAEVIRLPEPRLEPFPLPTLLRNVYQLMLPLAKKQGTQLRVEVPFLNITRRIDEKQLEQALVNMVKNALESLQTGGHIILRLDTTPLQLVVADNGPGLSPSIRDNINMPFFSTKPNGQGIGLTLIREIASAHDAFVQLETMENGWTEGRIVFKQMLQGNSN